MKKCLLIKAQLLNTFKDHLIVETLSPTAKNDDEWLWWSTISVLNCNEITKKEFENIFKNFNMKIKIFHYTKETGKILNETLSQSLLMPYFHRKIVRK